MYTIIVKYVISDFGGQEYTKTVPVFGEDAAYAYAKKILECINVCETVIINDITGEVMA